MCQNGAVVLVRICHSPPVLQFRKWNSCKLLILSDLLWNLRRDSDREWSLYCTNTRHGGVCKNPAFRQLAEAKDRKSAMRLVEQEIARAPQDMDVRAWRARVLAWSGQLPEAENEYREILKTGPI